MYIRFWDDKYAIKSDPYCYIISQINKKAEGEETETNLSFHSSIAAAIKSVAEREERANDAKDLKAYIKHIEDVDNHLEALVLTIAELVGPEEALARAMDVIPNNLPDKLKKLGDKK